LFHRLLLELEEKDGDGYVVVCTALLDMGDRGRKQVAKHLQRLRDRTRGDGRIHDLTLVFADAQPTFGITLFVGPERRAPEIAEKLRSFCLLKKYQTRVQRWVGVASLADQQSLVHA